MFKKVEECRLCGGKSLETVFNMGKQFVVTFIRPEEIEDWKSGKVEQPIPLSLIVCERCTFVQLGESVQADRLYRRFWYRSGGNESMVATLREIVQTACNRVQKWNDMAVIDIGSNDGTTLSFYNDNVLKVGFDPARNLTEEAKVKAKTPHIFAEYFSDEYVEELLRLSPDGYHIITAIAMFYDLEEPARFLNTIKKVLHKNGVFIIQMNYLLEMLKQHAIDNIAHEHLGYYSLKVLDKLMTLCGLMIVDAELNNVNGGSIKVTIGHMQLPGHLWFEHVMVTPESATRIAEIVEKEKQASLSDIETYRAFNRTMSDIVWKVENYIRQCANRRQKIYLYGASTRGSTFMQLLNADVIKLIQGAAERNPEKYGHFMVGTWIPIVSEEEARKHADVFLVLPWHFRQAIIEREKQTMEEGTELLFALPAPTIYSVKAL